MKKYQTTTTVTLACILISSALISCSKETDVQAPSSIQNSEATQAVSRDASSMANFFKTPFTSQVTTTTITDDNTLIFDFIVRKSFTKGDNNRLLLPYGDDQFMSRGWKYEVLFDTSANEIFLFPNDKMKADIVAGSFTTVSAIFDPVTKDFIFITRFKELNGDKSEVAESIFKGKP